MNALNIRTRTAITAVSLAAAVATTSLFAGPAASAEPVTQVSMKPTSIESLEMRLEAIERQLRQARQQRDAEKAEQATDDDDWPRSYWERQSYYGN